MRKTSTSPEATQQLGQRLAQRLLPDGVLLLYGEMGSGKTVLAKGVAVGLGIDPAEVRSPTYTLISEHHGPKGRLVHVDLYRLSAIDLERIGIEETMAQPGIKVVEWAERLPGEWPGTVRLRLERLPDGRRRIEELPPLLS